MKKAAWLENTAQTRSAARMACEELVEEGVLIEAEEGAGVVGVLTGEEGGCAGVFDGVPGAFDGVASAFDIDGVSSEFSVASLSFESKIVWSCSTAFVLACSSPIWISLTPATSAGSRSNGVRTCWTSLLRLRTYVVSLWRRGGKPPA